MAFKATDNGVWPSLAIELATQVGNDAPKAKSATKVVQTLSLAPAIGAKFEHKNGRPVKVTFSLPKDIVNIFSYKATVKSIAEGHERELKAGERRHGGCTTSLSKVLGIEFCSKMVTPKPFINSNTPFLPLNGPVDMELTLKKTDHAMRGWEFTLELPHEMTEMQVYRIGFNTPGSRDDRELAAELTLTTPRNGAKGARLRVKTPKKTVDASASHHWDTTTALTRAELIVDNKDKYSVEVGLDKTSQFKKSEWKPRLRIVMPNARPISLGGSVMLDQGSYCTLRQLELF